MLVNNLNALEMWILKHIQNTSMLIETEERMIDWCLMLTKAVFQLYRGVNKFYINIRHP